MSQPKRKQQTSISLAPEDFEFARQNGIDLSRVATAHIAAERRKQEVTEAFKSVEHVMTHLMSDKDGIARYVKSKRVW
ncbi:MAG: hypothetical protein FIA89_04615 [Geobacter sp.]|jgi:hypothetical protein|nr:hypothetical protein [Geobacter sp.]